MFASLVESSLAAESEPNNRMLLRYLLSNWARQTAQQKLREAVANAGKPAGSSSETGDTEPPPPPPPAEVVCVFALGAEAGGLVDLLRDQVTSRCATFLEYAGTLGNRRLAVIESGVGQNAAAQATEDAIAIHQPKWVISAGFAGALHEDLRRGHILMPSQVVETGHARLEVGLKLDPDTITSTPSLHSGPLLTVDKLVRTTAEKRALAEQYAAVACDMETFAVASACQESGTRFISVRVISDALEDELPKEVESLLNQDSLASKLGAATGAIFNRPSSIKDMWNLKEQAIKASDRLARFLSSTIDQLPG